MATDKRLLRMLEDASMRDIETGGESSRRVEEGHRLGCTQGDCVTDCPIGGSLRPEFKPAGLPRLEYGRDGEPILRGTLGVLSPDIRLQGGSIKCAPPWVLEWLGADPLCLCGEPVDCFRIPRAFEGVIGYCVSCYALVGVEGEEP